ncbi:MAG: hypothetical protein R3B97_10800 [Dehalococcoidia bacterium]
MPNQQHASFTTRLALAMAACLALLAAMAPVRAGAQAPASVALLAQRFSGVTTPGPNFDLVQSVIDFGPGAKGAEITAPVPHYVSAVGVTWWPISTVRRKRSPPEGDRRSGWRETCDQQCEHGRDYPRLRLVTAPARCHRERPPALWPWRDDLRDVAPHDVRRTRYGGHHPVWGEV